MKAKSFLLVLVGFVVGVVVGAGGLYLIASEGIIVLASKNDSEVTTSTQDTTSGNENQNKTSDTDANTGDESAKSEPELADEQPAPVDASNPSAAEVAEPVENSLFAGYDWPEAEIDGGIPKPNFNVNPSAVNTNSNSVSVEYENVPMNDALAYIEEIKNCGYTYEASENKGADMYSYRAYNGTDYLSSASISLQYMNSQKFSIMYSKPIR